jgi:hypothetical protein
LEYLQGREHLEDLGVDRRIILRRTLEKQGVGMWTGFIQLKTGDKAGFSENGNKLLVP